MTSEYVQLLRLGPFPGRVDPWAETARYFQQIHSNIIGALQAQMADPLLNLGYIASKEASLQIREIRIPDITIQHVPGTPLPEKKRLNYEGAALAAMVEPGVVVETELPELEAIYIREIQTERLITVIELISPRNKTHPPEMLMYRSNRTQLFLANGVNVVEIDLTRSYHRLLEHTLTESYPYNTIIFIPAESPRVIVCEFNRPLKPCAVPLVSEVVVVNLQSAYDRGYYEAMIAPQIYHTLAYDPLRIPFPTLLTEQQRQEAIQAVETWQKELAALKPAG